MIEASAGMISAGEPQPPEADILDEHEMTAISEERLEDLGISLASRRDEWVTARKSSGVEKRWMEDLDQYHGRDASTKMAASMMESAEQGYPITNKDAKPQRSTVYVNITRPKTNAAEARLSNMLFPSDDRNWGLKPTPAPELIRAALIEAKAEAEKEAQAASAPPQGQPQGQPMPTGAQPMPQQGMPPQPAQQGAQPAMPQMSALPAAIAGVINSNQQELSASQKLQEAEDRCKAMQDEIDDQLTECQYNGEGRKLLHNCAVLGTGILKGPIVVNRPRKAWTPMQGAADPSVFVLEIVEETKPASESISPWNVFPDPACGADIHSGRGIFEFRTISSKQLRELAKQPGYLAHQIEKVLEEGPDQSEYTSEHDQRKQNDNADKTHDSEHFQLWEYWGEFTPEDMRSAGVEIKDSSVETVSGCVIIVNKTVIKGFLNPIETGDIPYDFVQWELVDDSPWGYGIPFLMRPAQRVLNAAWRQLMDNSGLSSGPQVLVKRNGIEPADKKWEITGRKIWLVDENVQTQDAMRFLETQNHGNEIQQIITLAMQFADQEASVPQLAQGEHGNAPDTVGGMTILMNSSNVVLGRMVKQFDDCITRPHLRRYYDWNMAYSDKPEIKGDFQVDARGSSALLVKDMQSQSLLQLGQFQGSPLIAPFVNWEAWFKQVLKMQHIDSGDIMKTAAEIAKLQTAPSSPPLPVMIEQMKGQNALQLQQAKAQAELQVTQQELAHEQQMLQTGQATPHMAQATSRIEQERIRAQTAILVEQSRAHAEAARADKELEVARQNGEFRIRELELKREVAILEYSNKQQISINDAKTQLAKSAMDNKTKQQLAEAEIQLAQNEGDKNRQLDVHKHAVSLQRDMMTTPNTP